MKVKLNEIPEEGLTLTERFDPVQMKLQTSEMKFKAPVEVAATFHKERETVWAHVETSGHLQMTCGRCLEVYPEGFDSRFDLDYSVKDQWVLDVTDDIRQEILLSYPVKFLCREDCRGLCPHCGKNLNEGNCSHGSS